MKKRALTTTKYFVLTVIAILTIFPLVFMLTNSFMGTREILVNYNFAAMLPGEFTGFKLIPNMVTLQQYYQALFEEPKFIVMFWNSVILTVPTVLIQVVVATLAAYGFAKFKFPHSDKLFILFIIMMLMPSQVTLLPNYIMLKWLKLINTYAAVILPGAFSAFGVFLLRQYMKTIPDDYCEAAQIDGAGPLQVFFKIIMPQCAGGVAALAILNFIDNWNNVETPLVMLNDSSMHPLSVLMSYINSQNLGIAFACGMLFVLPAIMIFIIGEEYLVEGIQNSELK